MALVIKSKTNSYRKEGNIILVYTIGSNLTDATKAKAELAEYEASQGSYFRKSDAGEPLYFSQRVCEVGAQLTKTYRGRFQVLQDLETKAENREAMIETASAQYLGKLDALGIKPSVMRARMLMEL